ncbi:MerR family transcriptional regulator [Actinopolymorpha singaporensis]|uniref:DNA-binding transcriptional regulator, MerR family n=1 Tax=Actinopolymorpha singaporensis TaxID=117157 RepID=A0A1H1WVM8_9ACTN|nr:MerR family transcriptional regulator [Actinopolymorpha singaporensis]SDT00436.1 DNA-binding transcriptional regulator, MerR family [Actinopolymorpha singaporensis]
MNSYSSGQAADRSGFSIDTLRYYERIGLLKGINRTESGQRRFTDEDVTWLRLLRCMRDTEMPLAEMRRYADLHRAGPARLVERLALLEEHGRRVEHRLAHLQSCWTVIQDEIQTAAEAEQPVS